MKRMLAILCAALLLAACTARPSGAASEGSGTDAAGATATSAPVPPDWEPTHPVTLIVAYKAGSSTDQSARLLAQYAENYIGQPIQIRNIAANSGMTAWETLAAAAPDGYTLGFINMPNIFSAIENGAAFSMQDFTPICNHVVETSVIVVSADSPYLTLEDLLQANREASADGTYLRAATNGVQASNDIGAALLAYTSGGWKFRHVSYGSTSDQINAILTGECDWGVVKVSDVLPYLPGDADEQDAEGSEEPEMELNGEVTLSAPEEETALPSNELQELFPLEEPTEETVQPAYDYFELTRPQESEDGSLAPEEELPAAEHLRALGIFDTSRARELPDVPTLDEQGYPTGWYGSMRGIVAPAGTDPVIIRYYTDKFYQVIMADPDCYQAHQEAGLSLYYLDAEAFADRIDERERFNHSLLPRLFAS